MAASGYGLFFGVLLAIVNLATPHGLETPESLEEYKNLQDLQNVYVRKYLDEFERMEMKIEDQKEKDALEEVKLLIVQSWIYTLKPNVELLKDIFMDEKVSTLEEATVEIKKKIQHRNEQMPVKDAILVYVEGAEEQMKNDLNGRISELKEVVSFKSLQIDNAKDENKRKELLEKKIDKGSKLEELVFYDGFHKIARRMCLQSYVLDFAENKEGEKIVIESTEGKKKEFFMPPLKEGDFWSFVKETEVTREEAKVV